MSDNKKLIAEIDSEIARLEKRKKLLQKLDTRLHDNEGVNQFLNTYNGKSLLGKHKLDEYGTWEVRGEDPNCDLAGPHHNPFLGHFEGKLEDVLVNAVSLNYFWTWGAGGEIKKVEPIPVIKL